MKTYICVAVLMCLFCSPTFGGLIFDSANRGVSGLNSFEGLGVYNASGKVFRGSGSISSNIDPNAFHAVVASGAGSGSSGFSEFGGGGASITTHFHVEQIYAYRMFGSMCAFASDAGSTARIGLLGDGNEIQEFSESFGESEFDVSGVLSPEISYQLSASGIADPPAMSDGSAEFVIDFVAFPIPTIYADADQDGVVGLADFFILKSNFGEEGKTLPEGYFEGYFDLDEVVGLDDFDILVQQFGQSMETTTVGVPEPASVIIAAMALLGLVVNIRRR